MKLTSLFTILGCAALISAAPIRIVVYSKSDNGSALQHIRVGHAAAHMMDHPRPAIAIGSAMPTAVAMPASRMGKKPCAGAKSLRLSNWFREAVGLPPVNPHARIEPAAVIRIPTFAPTPRPPGSVHILPIVPDPKYMHGHIHGHVHGPHGRHGRKSFSHRLQFALLSLGPWEGRIVAFVLGCGIGVLLRLFWVMGVLIVRSVRGDVEEREVLYIEEEEFLLAPPEYTDEKVFLAKAQAEAPAA